MPTKPRLSDEELSAMVAERVAARMVGSRQKRGDGSMHKPSEPVLSTSDVERFLDKVELEPNTGCWLWMGGVNGGGYGQLQDPVLKKTRKAHRVFFRALVGPIPTGMQIDHKCRQRSCVNPDHLRVCTNRENANFPGALHGKTRPLKTHCVNGHFLTAENTTARPDSGRRCLQCKKDNNHKHNQARSRRRALKREGSSSGK